jgi:hypothetical protein
MSSNFLNVYVNMMTAVKPPEHRVATSTYLDGQVAAMRAVEAVQRTCGRGTRP